MLRLQKCSLKQGIVFRHCLVYRMQFLLVHSYKISHHLLIVWHHFLAVHWSWFCMSLLCCRSWLGSLWRGLTKVFSDNSSQCSFFNHHPHWPQEAGHHMVDAMAANLFDMFKVGGNTYNFCLWVVVVPYPLENTPTPQNKPPPPPIFTKGSSITQKYAHPTNQNNM